MDFGLMRGSAKPDGINNPFSPYGSPFSNRSATIPFATDAPRLFVRLSGFSDLSGSSGWFSGPVNKTDPIDQINEIDQFRFSVLAGLDQESLWPGIPTAPSSPTNPYGHGLRIEGR